jgi:hypothetical protein
MSKRFIILAALALSLVPVSRVVAATVSIAPVGLPSAKASRSELKYALGKNWEAAIRLEVQADIEAPKLFTSVPAEGGDWTFGFALDGVKRTFEDRVAVAGWGKIGFAVEGRWTWTRGGAVVREGTFAVSHTIKVDRQPWRSDLENGWREVIRLAVSEAVSGGLAAGIQENP